MREHYKAAADRSPAARKKLIGPPFPQELKRQYNIFTQISALRTYSQFGGINPITWLDIMAWSWLHNEQLQPWELDVIIKLDSTMLAILSKKT